MKGYNFDILESFQSYVHNLAENMGVDVEDAWATPARSYKVRVVTVFENMGVDVEDAWATPARSYKVRVKGCNCYG
jgi:ribosomal protein L12E/L44/L45/RPP1/RPP2